MTKIIFSEGHGAGSRFNRGFIGGNEGDNNLKLSNGIYNYLSDRYDVELFGIRRDGENVDHSLSNRASMGAGNDLFYSVHSNAFNGSVSGVEIILSYQSKSYYHFAKGLTALISKILGIQDRGVKFRNRSNGAFENYNQANTRSSNWYGELYNNRAKCAMIVEHFFHDNRRDINSYNKNFDKLVEGIAKHIAEYFDLPPAQKTSEIYYRVVTDSYKSIDNAKQRQKELADKGIETFIAPFEI